MADKYKCLTTFACFLVQCALGAHVAGFLTPYWFIGTTDEPTDANITNVHLGLWREHIQYGNDTSVVSDSPLNIREEQIITLAITGINALFCLVLACKSIQLCVGISAFFIMSLMLLVTALFYEALEGRMKQLQLLRPDWPQLKFWWSLYLVFGSLFLNIFASVMFLAILLIKGEIKATHSSKGLGPEDVKTKYDTKPLIAVKSVDNYAYDTEHDSQVTNKEPISGISYATPDSDNVFYEPNDLGSGSSSVLDTRIYDPEVYDNNSQSGSGYPRQNENDIKEYSLASLNETEVQIEDDKIPTVSESVRL